MHTPLRKGVTKHWTGQCTAVLCKQSPCTPIAMEAAGDVSLSSLLPNSALKKRLALLAVSACIFSGLEAYNGFVSTVLRYVKRYLEWPVV